MANRPDSTKPSTSIEVHGVEYFVTRNPTRIYSVRHWFPVTSPRGTTEHTLVGQETSEHEVVVRALETRDQHIAYR